MVVLTATPMPLPGMCALCFGPHGGGVWALRGPYEAVRVNVCVDCRLTEIGLLIRHRSAYSGNGHPPACPCLECT